MAAVARRYRVSPALVAQWNKTTAQGDPIHWEGGYEDSFEKTRNGWRFKSRVHVWSEIKWTDNPADMPPHPLNRSITSTS